jgi:solute:Na+ symporter, SSS family
LSRKLLQEKKTTTLTDKVLFCFQRKGDYFISPFFYSLDEILLLLAIKKTCCMLIKIITLALYALMILVIGIIGLRKTKSSKDFLLGGGNIGPWMSAFSYGTAYFSAVLFIGFAGKIGWGFGLSGLWIALFNALLGVLTVWLLMGWKIKQASLKYNISTMSEFLERRYHSSTLKLIAAIVIFIFLIPYSAAVFMGLSYLFEISLGIPYVWILAGMGIFTATYIVLGGYKSMAMIDMIFGLIMAVSVILLFYFTLDKGDGMTEIVAKLRSIEPKLTSTVGPPGLWPLLSLILLTSLAPFAMPQLVQKFYAIRDQRSVKIGAVASTFFAILIGGVAYFTGATTRVFLSPETSPSAFMDGSPNFDKLMPEVLTNVIPSSLAVIILLLILSASMSTLASLVLISSSSFTKDFWAGFVNKNISDRSQTMMMRFMSAVFVLLAVLFAAVELDVIVEILGISWGALGSFFLGPFVWGLFSKRVNRLGAFVSGIGGLAVCLGLYFSGMPSPEAGTLGMGASLLLNPLFSLFCKKEIQA